MRAAGRTAVLISLGAAPAAAALLVYSRALGAGLFSDDYTWMGRMAATERHPLFVFSVFYRDFNPIFHASLTLDDLLGGGRPGFFHATSILIHGACAALLAVVCRRLGAHQVTAVAAALPWALGARWSEAVIWPAARAHLLAALFVLAALALLAGPAGDGAKRIVRSPMAVATGLFLAALLSKETALFPMLLAPLFASPPPACATPGGLRPRLARWLPPAVLAAGFVVFNVCAKPSFHLPPVSAGGLLLKVPFILLRPLGLGDLYDFSPLAAVAVLVAFSAAAFLLRRSRTGRAGIAWILVCLVPVAPLQKLSSRYLYLLSIGYVLVLCGAVEEAARRLERPAPRRLAASLAGTALVLIAAANVLLVQREIDDYALLGRPYAECLQALGGPAEALVPGETLVVADTGSRDAVVRLTRAIEERGSITKLVPFRARAVGGLVDLRDAVNMTRRGRDGLFAVAADPAAPGPLRIAIYDGRQASAAPALPAVPPERIAAVRLGSLAEYLADARREEAR
jgi:hypothetical protein